MDEQADRFLTSKNKQVISGFWIGLIILMTPPPTAHPITPSPTSAELLGIGVSLIQFGTGTVLASVLGLVLPDPIAKHFPCSWTVSAPVLSW